MRILVLVLLLTAVALGQERKLVSIKKDTFGYFAEVSPEFDHTAYQTRTYRIEGGDPAALEAAAVSSGLPARLLGVYSGGKVKIAILKPGQAPPLLPLPVGLQKGPSRGRVFARPAAPAGVPGANDVAGPAGATGLAGPAGAAGVAGPAGAPGGGRLFASLENGELAELAFESGQERERWLKRPEGSWLECSSWTAQGRSVAADIKVLDPPLKPTHAGAMRFYAQISEGFFSQAAEMYRRHNLEKFSWQNAFTVEEVGATLQNSPPGAVRFFGTLRGNLPGVGTLAEGQWESVARLGFSAAGNLHLSFIPSALSARITKPIYLELPVSWMAGLLHVLTQGLSSGVTLPVPSAYTKELLATGALEPAHIKGFKAWTFQTGDRRSNFLVIGVPLQGPDKGPDLAERRLRDDKDFLMALSAPALDAAFRHQIAPLLPMRVPVKAAGPSVGFLKLIIDDVEIDQLELAYKGAISLENCTTRIHWSLGPLSGEEPGAVVKGWVRVQLAGDPPQLVGRVEPQYLEFLSPRIREQSPEDQQILREQLVATLGNLFVPLPVPTKLELPQLGSAVLQLTDVRAVPDALQLHGRLMTP